MKNAGAESYSLGAPGYWAPVRQQPCSDNTVVTKRSSSCGSLASGISKSLSPFSSQLRRSLVGSAA